MDWTDYEISRHEDDVRDRIAQLEEDLRLALPYVKNMGYNIAVAMQIEAHLEGREPWEPKED